MYITVIDPKGFEVGFNTGVFQPCEHRVLIENGHVHGAENLTRHFRSKSGQFNQAEWGMFLGLLGALPVGEYRNLNWKHE